MITELWFYIAVFVSVIGVINSYKIFRVKIYTQKTWNANKDIFYDDTQLPNFVILLPLLRETKYVKTLLEKIANIQYPKDKLKVIIITSIRENEILKEGEDTISLVVRNIERLNVSLREKLFIHYHSTDFEGIKSDQLNFGIKEFVKENPHMDKDKTYVGIYDADSIIQENTLKIIGLDSVKNNFPPAYQQPTYYFANYERPSESLLENIFSRAFGLLQTSYAFYVENYNYIDRYPILVPFPKLLYLVGHGMFITLSTLEKVNFFPSPIEDTRLGHILSFLNIPIRLVFIPDSVDVATSVWRRIRQSSVWFLGVTYFRKDFKIANGISRVSIIKKYWFYLYRIYRNTIWVTRGILIWVLILLGLYVKFLGLTLLMVFLYLYLPVISMIYTVNKISPRETQSIYMGNLIPSLIILPIEYLLMSTGALYGLGKMIFMHNSSKKDLFPKTEK